MLVSLARLPRALCARKCTAMHTNVAKKTEMRNVWYASQIFTTIFPRLPTYSPRLKNGASARNVVFLGALYRRSFVAP